MEHVLKLLVSILITCSMIIAVSWLYYDRTFEPLIATITAFIAFIMRLKFHNFSIMRLPLLSKILLWKKKSKPIAVLTFKTCIKSEIHNHCIKAYNIWHENYPTEKIEFRHKIDNGSWYTFSVIEGHTPKLILQDINNDNHDELILRYHCGAHTHVIELFTFDHQGFISSIPGGKIGSDFGDIQILDRFKNIEIQAKHRNWSDQSAGYILNTYIYSADRIKLLHEQVLPYGTPKN